MRIAQCWRPKDAWVFAGLVILYALLFDIINVSLSAAFTSWAGILRVQGVNSALFVFNLAIVCAISAFVGKIRTFSEFKAAFDLTKPQEKELLGAAAIGVVLQFGGIILFTRDLSLSHLHLAQSFDIKKIPPLISPLFEEPSMRGFVYKAFRNTYGVAMSVILVVLINVIFHTQVYGSLYRFVMIVALNVTLCLIKEKRPNLWNCIACHFAFNAIYAGMDQN